MFTVFTILRPITADNTFLIFKAVLNNTWRFLLVVTGGGNRQYIWKQAAEFFFYAYSFCSQLFMSGAKCTRPSSMPAA